MNFSFWCLPSYIALFYYEFINFSNKNIIIVLLSPLFVSRAQRISEVPQPCGPGKAGHNHPFWATTPCQRATHNSTCLAISNKRHLSKHQRYTVAMAQSVVSRAYDYVLDILTGRHPLSFLLPIGLWLMDAVLTGMVIWKVPCTRKPRLLPSSAVLVSHI